MCCVRDRWERNNKAKIIRQRNVTKKFAAAVKEHDATDIRSYTFCEDEHCPMRRRTFSGHVRGTDFTGCERGKRQVRERTANSVPSASLQLLACHTPVILRVSAFRAFSRHRCCRADRLAQSIYDIVLTSQELVLEFRDATAADADAIVGIYNHYVATTVISFEEDAVTELAMRERIAEIQKAGLPWLVATLDGEMVAYAYASNWRVRAAYRFSVESTVYVDKDYSGRGLGTAVYSALIERLRQAGRHVVIGGIALPNDASVALHEKMGSRKVAHFAEVGLKFDRWIDVGYWQLKL